MDNDTLETDVRAIIDTATARLLAPRPGECLACYVFRQLGEFGCDGTHRFATRFRDETAPRATALLTRLSSMGACCCDCEMFLNAYEFAPRPWVARSYLGAAIGTPIDTEMLIDTGALADGSAPPKETFYLCCQMVRRGSTQPCADWQRQNRYRW